MKIVVDTNIVFSLLLNSNGSIGDIFFNSDEQLEFYSCSYLKHEIKKHWGKLKSISRLNEDDLQVSYDLIINRIKFISEEIIPLEVWLSSEIIADRIDSNDIDFIALTDFIGATLWTGDKVLYNGLTEINFKSVTNTAELLQIRKK
ncbi:MAG TPA: PIN domain-containing protein [Pelobium sp.]|nr:PIN domain-containing protein [Pelobium sp.]